MHPTFQRQLLRNMETSISGRVPMKELKDKFDVIGNVGVKYILVGLIDYSPVCLLIYVSLIVICQRGVILLKTLKNSNSSVNIINGHTFQW